MTLGEFRSKTADLSDDLDLFIHQTWDEGAYSTVETVEVRPVTFGAPDVPKKEWAIVDCLLITDNL